MNQWRSYDFFRKREVSVSGFFLSFTLKWCKSVDDLFHNMVVDSPLFSCEVGGVQPGGHNAVCFIRTSGTPLITQRRLSFLRAFACSPQREL